MPPESRTRSASRTGGRSRSSSGRSARGVSRGGSPSRYSRGRRRRRVQTTPFVLLATLLTLIASGLYLYDPRRPPGFWPVAQGGPAVLATPSTQPEIGPPEDVTLAFYNIEHFTARNTQRVAKLREVVRNVNADVWALSEINSRADLTAIFPADEFDIRMIDDPGQTQELALVARKPFRFHQPGATMVFPGSAYDSAFPGRRDLLGATVVTPNGRHLFVFSIHAKARVGGRMETEPRRVEHSRLIVEYLRQNYKLDEQYVALLGDFNDSPDDPAMNVLETGDLGAQAAMDDEPDTFLVNLGEVPWAEEHATLGLTSSHMGQNGRVETRIPGIRAHNFRLRSEPQVPYREVMFDMIVVSPALARGLDGRMLIYDGPESVGSGKSEDRASDHQPVYARFRLE